MKRRLHGNFGFAGWTETNDYVSSCYCFSDLFQYHVFQMLVAILNSGALIIAYLRAFIHRLTLAEI